MNGTQQCSDSLDRVPNELRERPQWVLWRSTRRGGGKPTKTPCKPNGEPALVDDPTTWTTFDEAAKTWSADPTRFAGIGYVFAHDDPYVGVDLDGCIDRDGAIAAWADERLTSFGGSYAEISPSGTGIKIWARGRLNGPGKRLKLATGSRAAVEIYDRARFFCVTGAVFGEPCPSIPDRQEAADALYRWIEAERAGRRPPPPPAPPRAAWRPRRAGGPTAADRARRYVARMEGSIEGQGGDDQAFNVACALMQRFGLTTAEATPIYQEWNMRCEPPWDDARLARNLRRAGGEVTDGRTPGWKLSEPQSNGRQSPPPPPDRPDDVDARLATFARTDTGDAERLVARFGGRIRYCYPWAKWLAYDGRRWAVDANGAIDRAAKATARGMLVEAATIDDDGERKRHAAHALASESRLRRAAMVGLAQSEHGVPIQVDDMNKDPWLFNCLNGTIDLKTGRLQAHDKADMITQLAPVAFDPDAECPMWLSTLDLFFAGDQKLIHFWQRMCGYALTGVIREHALPILYGTGSNGKSTILCALLDTMGPDYSMQAPPSLLMAKRSESHPSEICDLFGKRLVAAVETGEGRRLDESLVKQLTGGDHIRARRMREDFWEFAPSHHIMMATNHKPLIRGTDVGIWRRLRLVPFNVQIDGAAADLAMSSKLKSERAGILAWMVRGCLSWQEIGLEEPESVREATCEYRSDSDLIGRFLDEHTLADSTLRTKCGDLYTRFKTWVDASGEREVSLTHLWADHERARIHDTED